MPQSSNVRPKSKLKIFDQMNIISGRIDSLNTHRNGFIGMDEKNVTGNGSQIRRAEREKNTYTQTGIRVESGCEMDEPI